VSRYQLNTGRPVWNRLTVDAEIAFALETENALPLQSGQRRFRHGNRSAHQKGVRVMSRGRCCPPRSCPGWRSEQASYRGRTSHSTLCAAGTPSGSHL